jgi:hypothetical protein
VVVKALGIDEFEWFWEQQAKRRGWGTARLFNSFFLVRTRTFTLGCCVGVDRGLVRWVSQATGFRTSYE